MVGISFPFSENSYFITLGNNDETRLKSGRVGKPIEALDSQTIGEW
jgi:hypothetical protein